MKHGLLSLTVYLWNRCCHKVSTEQFNPYVQSKRYYDEHIRKYKIPLDLTSLKCLYHHLLANLCLWVVFETYRIVSEGIVKYNDVVAVGT